MAALTQGSRVVLTEGTRVGLDNGGGVGGGGRYDWFVVGEGEGGEALVGLPWLVAHVGLCHHTMNGGGREYLLVDEASGTKATVRTTFQRPEGATFTTARRPR